jgi:hypothetical protein
VNDIGGTEKQREGAVERLDMDVMRPGTLRSEVSKPRPAWTTNERAEMAVFSPRASTA